MDLAMHDLPGSLRLTSAFPFVGRSSELETLRALLPTVAGEGRRVVLLGGEAGSGKSRLVREFAVEAAGAGALVLYGACDAVVPTPYEPFVQSLDHLVRQIEPDELRTALGGAGGELARLLPNLHRRVKDLPAPVPADPDTERHRLHTAVTELLTVVGRRRPVLLVLEDGHWADAPTLLLLRHLARGAAEARLLLLATFRDAEADMPMGLSEALADLRRSDDVVRLRLTGLSGDEVTEFVRRASEGGAGDELLELARAISDLTEGNPFLVCELWRTLVETGMVELGEGGAMRLTRPLTELGTPDSVQEVVSQRLYRLAPGTADLLELAATAGSEFDLALVRRAAALPEPELVAALDEAVRSGIIEELPGRRLSYRFTHELVRRALYDRLSGVRRAELHLRVGGAWEDTGPRSGRVLAELAHHFAAAAPFGEVRRGVEYNLLAARAAMAALSYDEASERVRAALDLGIEDPAERAEAFLELGSASHRAGKAGDAVEAFRAAVEIAHELRDPELIARAAIGYEDACWRPGIVDDRALELLEDAAAALGDGAPELRVRLLAGLARALDYRGEFERGAIARGEAVQLARRLGDRAGLALLLVRSYWSRGTTPLEEVIEMLSEAKVLGEEVGDIEIRAEALSWRVPAFVALGNVAAAARDAALLAEIAEEAAQPFMLHVAEHYGSALALGLGRLDEAESRAVRSHEWGSLLTGRNPSGSYGIQMFSVRREQGRLASLAPALRVLAAEPKRGGPWRPGLVSLLVELGMDGEARRELARIASEGLEPYRESLWLASLAYLADAAAALGDEDVAALVYPELEPLQGQNFVIGQLVAWYGAADRHLGMLAATLGEWERAEEHFERALELNRGMGALTWIARTAYEYARVRLLRGSGERPRAEALLGEAAGLAERIGMAGLMVRIAALGSAVRPASLPDGLSPREAEILRLVARGLSNREIGAELFISEHTAANHIRSILRKTGSGNRTEAASYAHRHGLAEQPTHG